MRQNYREISLSDYGAGAVVRTAVRQTVAPDDAVSVFRGDVDPEDQQTLRIQGRDTETGGRC